MRMGRITNDAAAIACSWPCAIGRGPDTYASLEASMGPPGPSGYSMQQLADQAHKYGAKTTAVETSLENLSAREECFVCISLLKKGHFVVLYDVDRKNVYLIDPPRDYVLPIDTFRQRWTQMPSSSAQPISDPRNRFVAHGTSRPCFSEPLAFLLALDSSVGGGADIVPGGQDGSTEKVPSSSRR